MVALEPGTGRREHGALILKADWPIFMNGLNGALKKLQRASPNPLFRPFLQLCLSALLDDSVAFLSFVLIFALWSIAGQAWPVFFFWSVGEWRVYWDFTCTGTQVSKFRRSEGNRG